MVGVLKDRTPRGGTPSGGQAAEDFNMDVYIPLYTCQLRFGQRMIIRQGGSRSGEQVQLHQITLTVSDIDQVRSTGEVVVNPGRSYFDTNTADHHHFFFEETGRLMDIPSDSIRVSNLPKPPQGEKLRAWDPI